MKTPIFIGALLVVAATQTQACEPDLSAGVGPPHSLFLRNALQIDADAPVSTTVPVFSYDSSLQGTQISYINCLKGTPYGKSPYNPAAGFY